MGEGIYSNSDISIAANILIKEEDGMFVAHCLELDIVAVGNSPEEAQRECVALICAQIEYAFAHNNLDNLYRSAPAEIWAEFFSCKAQEEKRYKIEKRLTEDTVGAPAKAILPPWLIAKTCQACHA